MAFGLGRLPSYGGGVYSRAQKTWVNSIVRVGGKGAEREEGEKARRAGREGGEEGEGRERREEETQQEQEARRSSTTAISRE